MTRRFDTLLFEILERLLNKRTRLRRLRASSNKGLVSNANVFLKCICSPTLCKLAKQFSLFVRHVLVCPFHLIHVLLANCKTFVWIVGDMALKSRLCVDMMSFHVFVFSGTFA